MRNKLYLMVFIIQVSIFTFFTNGYTLAPQTHKNINYYIAIKTLNQFSLNQYLKNQLGFQEGIETSLISKEVYEWLGEGGVKEDVPYWYMHYLRSVNHFHITIVKRVEGQITLKTDLPVKGGSRLLELSPQHD